MRDKLKAWFAIAPDSLAAHSIRRGKSPWVDGIHLIWSFWVFLMPFFNGLTLRWIVFTVISYPAFLLLYAKHNVAPFRTAWIYGAVLVVASLLLIPWYSSGFTYFVYGCLMLYSCRISMRTYLLVLIGLNVVSQVEALLMGYAWQTVVPIPFTTIALAMVIGAERDSAKKEAELRLSHDEVRRLAATAERERIGRDLHDLLGHTLSLITLKLELSRKLFDRDSEAARRELEEAEHVARQALAEVRAAVTGIRATDIAAELVSGKLLLESSSVHLDYGSLPVGMPPEVERGLSLVLREAMTNIARHAQATRASVLFARDDGAWSLSVEDNGRGGVRDDGNGLCGMRERVMALGGSVQVDSPPGKGTRVLVRVPLPPQRSVVASPARADVQPIVEHHAA